jgi:hypothetical protein
MVNSKSQYTGPTRQPPLFSPLAHAAATPCFDANAAAPSLPSCRPVTSRPEHSSAAAPTSQVVDIFARHPPCHPYRTPPVPQRTHACVQAHTQAWVTSLSPPQRAIAFAPSRSHALFIFLYRHCRRARSTATLPLCTTGATAKGLNGSALAPWCSPTQPHL